MTQWGAPSGPGWNRPAFRGQPYGRPSSPYGPPSPFGPPGQFAPFGAPPPPRRRSPLRGFFGGLVLLAVVAVIAVVFVNSATTTGTTSTNDNAAPYQNENYQVPPPDKNPPALPQPQTYSQAESLVTSNRFYSQTVPAPVRCDVGALHVATASDTQLAKHFNDLMACLLRVWEPPVVGAGFQIVRPSVTIYGSSVQTRCGKSGVNAFYCSADQQVYYSNQLPRYVSVLQSYDRAADVVMAHEFGHALQARTGILISAHALGQESGNSQTELVFSRRLETQADCFSGMWVRAVSVSLGLQQSDLTQIQSVYHAVGDDVVSGNPNINGDHGLARDRVYWGTQGINNSNASACNTFNAPASEVR